MTKEVFDEKPRSYWQGVITEWVHSELDRCLLNRRLLDGMTYSEIASEFGMSIDAVKKRIYKAQKQLFKHI